MQDKELKELNRLFIKHKIINEKTTNRQKILEKCTKAKNTSINDLSDKQRICDLCKKLDSYSESARSSRGSSHINEPGTLTISHTASPSINLGGGIAIGID